MFMGKKFESVEEVPCGNTVCVVGVEDVLKKTGMITNCEEAHNFAMMKFTVSPVVRLAMGVEKSGDLPKLVEGLRRLSVADSLCQVTRSESGEHVIAGAGELHLEICLKDLQEEYM